MAITWKKLAYEDDCILLSDLAAKGDVLSASAAGVLEVLSVGTNGKSLVAASGETSGLKWDTPTPAEHDLDTHTPTSGNKGDYLRMHLSTGIPTYTTPAELAATLALDDVGVPDAAVDFDLQEATDLVVMTVADEASLPAANVAIGQLCWATSELSFHICTVAV